MPFPRQNQAPEVFPTYFEQPQQQQKEEEDFYGNGLSQQPTTITNDFTPNPVFKFLDGGENIQVTIPKGGALENLAHKQPGLFSVIVSDRISSQQEMK